MRVVVGLVVDLTGGRDCMQTLKCLKLEEEDRPRDKNAPLPTLLWHHLERCIYKRLTDPTLPDVCAVNVPRLTMVWELSDIAKYNILSASFSLHKFLKLSPIHLEAFHKVEIGRGTLGLLKLSWYYKVAYLQKQSFADFLESFGRHFALRHFASVNCRWPHNIKTPGDGFAGDLRVRKFFSQGTA